MGERKTVRLENKQLDAISEMVEEGDADNESEALRTALNVGIVDMGYRNAEKRDTRLRTIARRFADAFALLGLMWVGVTFFLPVELRILAVAPFGACVGCLGLDRALEAVEPRVSNRLNRLFCWNRGEKA